LILVTFDTCRPQLVTLGACLTLVTLNKVLVVEWWTEQDVLEANAGGEAGGRGADTLRSLRHALGIEPTAAALHQVDTAATSHVL
jgi:hypothetical protein